MKGICEVFRELVQRLMDTEDDKSMSSESGDDAPSSTQSTAKEKRKKGLKRSSSMHVEVLQSDFSVCCLAIKFTFPVWSSHGYLHNHRIVFSPHADVRVTVKEPKNPTLIKRDWRPFYFVYVPKVKRVLCYQSAETMQETREHDVDLRLVFHELKP